MKNKSNTLCWNPMEPINFTVGNDDSNCYSFDMRKLNEIKVIHKDHINAVMDIDYSPTGQSFVTGAYDQTVRIFDTQGQKSREVYHGKRMQQVFAVAWTLDNQYILSGSDDMNLRIWKAQASKPIGVINKREQQALNYKSSLIQQFKHNKQIRKIDNHRHLPKYIKNAKDKKQIMKESRNQKENNKEMNDPNQYQKPEPERKSKITNQID